jgi:hypothetical protein
VGAAALITASIGPAAYAIDTIVTPHSGAIPAAGPATAGPFGGPGGGRAGGFGGLPGAQGTGGRPALAGGSAPAGARGGFPGGTRGVGQAPPGAAGFGPAAGGANFTPGANRGGGGGGIGGILSASTPGKALVAALEQDAGSYTWVAATINSNSAAGYQLATDDPVMAIGGFNGTDPAPTLAEFEQYVQAGKIHYFIAGGGGGAGGATGSSTGSTATQITNWVESHFTAKTVSGQTIYDLT